MIDYHRVPADRFAELAAGLGGPAAVEQLAAAQRSKHLLLLRFLSELCSADGEARRAVDVLIEAQRRNPGAVAELIGDPLVGAWAVWTTRRVRGRQDSAIPLAVDLAQLGALAAAAALRAGLNAEVGTQARAGCVTLPTLGAVRLGADGPAVVTVSGGQMTVSDGGTKVTTGPDDDRWLPLRRLTARHGELLCSIAVEDGNPYRDCYHAPPDERLTTAETERWQALFTEAWGLLGRYVPERAAELAGGVRSIVPLVTDDSGMARSGTARDTFGTLGLTRPRSATEFAITLVHEFQHSKLSVLLDLVPLYVAGGPERHFAPWRTDARPTGGLIQGVYAFLGVADTWRALRSAPGYEAEATREFAVVRRQVEIGLAALEASAELTAKGREFAAGLRSALIDQTLEPVPAWAAQEAEAALARRRRTWEHNNPGLIVSSGIRR